MDNFNSPSYFLGGCLTFMSIQHCNQFLSLTYITLLSPPPPLPLSLSLPFSLPSSLPPPHPLFLPPSLPLLQCCIQLAMGKLKPDQLTESVLSLVSARPPQQLTDPSLLAMPDDSSQHNRPSAEIIKMMVSLSDRATYAQQCCTTIIVCFRLAVVSLILLKVMRY